MSDPSPRDEGTDDVDGILVRHYERELVDGERICNTCLVQWTGEWMGTTGLYQCDVALLLRQLAAGRREIERLKAERDAYRGVAEARGELLSYSRPPAQVFERVRQAERAARDALYGRVAEEESA